MRTPALRRLALGAAALSIALAGLTACGSDETATDTSSAGSAESGEKVDPAEFVADFKAAFSNSTTAHLTMETEGQMSLSAEGDVDYSTSPPSMAMTMDNPMSADGMDVRLVDGTFYMSVPGGGEKFMSYDLGDPSNPLGGDFTEQLDPATAFDGFEDAIESVTYVGDEKVDGDQTRRYTVVIDGEKAAGAAAGESPEGDTGEEVRCPRGSPSTCGSTTTGSSGSCAATSARWVG